MSRAHSLYRLQEIDLALDINLARLETIDAILEESDEIRKAKSAVSVAEETLQSKQTLLDKAERKVDMQRAKISETEKMLYGGTITNPKELQDLHMEAESLKRFLSTLEDRLLDEMVEFEQADLEHQTAQHLLDNIKMRKAVEHKELNEEQERLINENDRLGSNREAALGSITQNDLQLYLQLRMKHGGQAVAFLEADGSCSTCGLSLSASLQQVIRSGSRIEQCGQCKRILYAG